MTTDQKPQGGAAGGNGNNVEHLPMQPLLVRLMKALTSVAANNDRLGELIASTKGQSVSTSAPATTTRDRPERRFFPALTKLITQLEAEAEKLTRQTDQLDKAL
jgi:hypothetical protein